MKFAKAVRIQTPSEINDIEALFKRRDASQF